MSISELADKESLIKRMFNTANVFFVPGEELVPRFLNIVTDYLSSPKHITLERFLVRFYNLRTDQYPNSSSKTIKTMFDIKSFLNNDTDSVHEGIHSRCSLSFALLGNFQSTTADGHF